MLDFCRYCHAAMLKTRTNSIMDMQEFITSPCKNHWNVPIKFARPAQVEHVPVDEPARLPGSYEEALSLMSRRFCREVYF